MPQLALQQTSPTLHVLGPHGALYGDIGPHWTWLHDAPGARHVPQLALQQTWPSAHVAAPHRTPREPASCARGCAAPLSCAALADDASVEGGAADATTRGPINDAMLAAGATRAIASARIPPPSINRRGSSRPASIAASSASADGAGASGTTRGAVDTEVVALADGVGAGSLTIGFDAQSLPAQVGTGAGGKRRWKVSLSSQCVRPTAPAANAARTTSAPMTQPASVLMERPPSAHYAPFWAAARAVASPNAFSKKPRKKGTLCGASSGPRADTASAVASKSAARSRAPLAAIEMAASRNR